MAAPTTKLLAVKYDAMTDKNSKPVSFARVLKIVPISKVEKRPSAIPLIASTK